MLKWPRSENACIPIFCIALDLCVRARGDGGGDGDRASVCMFFLPLLTLLSSLFCAYITRSDNVCKNCLWFFSPLPFVSLLHFAVCLCILFLFTVAISYAVAAAVADATLGRTSNRGKNPNPIFATSIDDFINSCPLICGTRSASARCQHAGSQFSKNSLANFASDASHLLNRNDCSFQFRWVGSTLANRRRTDSVSFVSARKNRDRDNIVMATGYWANGERAASGQRSIHRIKWTKIGWISGLARKENTKTQSQQQQQQQPEKQSATTPNAKPVSRNGSMHIEQWPMRCLRI